MALLVENFIIFFLFFFNLLGFIFKNVVEENLIINTSIQKHQLTFFIIDF